MGMNSRACQITLYSTSRCGFCDLSVKQIGPPIPKDWADYIGSNVSRSQLMLTNCVLQTEMMADAELALIAYSTTSIVVRAIAVALATLTF
jgi:hypothetical protein